MSVRILIGDVRAKLAELPDASVHCVVTSPPYFGLRDYGMAGQIGLEPTPAEFVAVMVDVFREVRRVMRDDGTLWLNLGDSYGGAAGNTRGKGVGGGTERGEVMFGDAQGRDKGGRSKDLLGIPWRVAFALQADGWYLRQDIIWSKPNPMPESVTDRCTKAHEQLFLFAKGQWKTRSVAFSDLTGEFVHFGNSLRFETANARAGDECILLATAILDCAEREQNCRLPPFYAEEWQQRPDGSDSDFVRGLPIEHRAAAWAARLLASQCSTEGFLCEINRVRLALPNGDDLLKRWCDTQRFLAPSVDANGETAIAIHNAGKVSKVDFVHEQIAVSTPTTCKYHYDAAAIAEAVTESSIAWLSQDVESQQGSARVPGKTNGTMKAVSGAYGHGAGRNDGDRHPSGGWTTGETKRNRRSVWTVATQPFSEAHFATFPPALIEPFILAGCPKGGAVLDPFGGAGTTGLVADRHGRDAILIELNPEYAAIAERRIKGDAGMFAEVVA